MHDYINPLPAISPILHHDATAPAPTDLQRRPGGEHGNHPARGGRQSGGGVGLAVLRGRGSGPGQPQHQHVDGRQQDVHAGGGVM